MTELNQQIPLKINIKAKSIFDSIELNEIIDKNELYKVINCEELKKLKDYDLLHTNLERIMKKVKNGKLRVKYSRKINAGRVYAFKGHSYQMINGIVRNALAYKNYIDIDMVNSHPTILNEVCKIHDIPHYKLKYYVENRDDIINRIMKTYNKTNKAVKSMFLTVLNCGGYKTYTNNQEDDFLEELTKELKLITAMVVSTNEKLSKAVEKLYKTQGKKFEKNKSTLSYFLQNYENIILEEVYNFLKDNDVIDNENVASLCYDGIMVKKNDKVNNDFLNTMEAYIKEETGFNVVFKVKPMDEKIIKFEEEKDIDFDDKKINYLDIKYMSGLPSYQLKKKYFELFYTMIYNPKPLFISRYMEMDKDKILKEKYTFQIDADIKTILKPVKSGIIDDKGNEMDFYKVWTEDADKKSKNYMDFLPYNPDEIFNENENIFNLFTGYDERIKTSYDNDLKEKYLKPYFDLIYELCGAKKENSDYYLKYMANIIQNPRHKAGICIEIRGFQGCGKNISLKPMENIIGKEHFISSSDINTFFSTHSIGYMKKLLVNLDEVNLSDSFKHEGKIKTAITGDKMDFNPKNQQPIQANNFSNTISFTNKKNGLKIDFASGDRRFVIYKSTKKYKIKVKNFWKNLDNHFDRPEFIACLYDYFMEMDLTGINWTNDRPITEEYKKSFRQFIPSESLFIIKCLDNMDMKYTDEEMEKIEEEKYNYESFYKEFMAYSDEFNLGGKHKPNIKSFYRSLTEIFDKDSININNKDVIINLNNTRESLICNGHINCDSEEYEKIKAKLNKGVIEEEDDYFNF